MEEKNKKIVNNNRSWIQYSQLGLQMLVTIAAGTYFGHWLDEKYPLGDTSHKLPIFTLCLSLISIGASLYNAIKQLPK